jgi:hypothetical protein
MPVLQNIINPIFENIYFSHEGGASKFLVALSMVMERTKPKQTLGSYVTNIFIGNLIL